MNVESFTEKGKATSIWTNRRRNMEARGLGQSSDENFSTDRTVAVVQRQASLREHHPSPEGDSATSDPMNIKSSLEIRNASDSAALFSGLVLSAIDDPKKSFAATLRIYGNIVDGTPYMQRIGCKALLCFASPEDILSAALINFKIYKYEGFLLPAASMLTALGERAYPALSALAASGRPECELFVASMAELPGINMSRRLSMLASLARNPHVAVRQRVVEAIGELNDSSARPILEYIATGFDDEAAQDASDRLSVAPF